MKDRESTRRGPREKPISQKETDEYTAAERMRQARMRAGKTLSDTGKELQYTPQHLSHVETGIYPVSKKLARQYERLFGCERGQIVNTVFERHRKSRKE